MHGNKSAVEIDACSKPPKSVSRSWFSCTSRSHLFLPKIFAQLTFRESKIDNSLQDQRSVRSLWHHLTVMKSLGKQERKLQWSSSVSRCACFVTRVSVCWQNTIIACTVSVLLALVIPIPEGWIPCGRRSPGSGQQSGASQQETPWSVLLASTEPWSLLQFL